MNEFLCIVPKIHVLVEVIFYFSYAIKIMQSEKTKRKFMDE